MWYGAQSIMKGAKKLPLIHRVGFSPGNTVLLIRKLPQDEDSICWIKKTIGCRKGGLKIIFITNLRLNHKSQLHFRINHKIYTYHLCVLSIFWPITTNLLKAIHEITNFDPITLLRLEASFQFKTYVCTNIWNLDFWWIKPLVGNHISYKFLHNFWKCICLCTQLCMVLWNYHACD